MPACSFPARRLLPSTVRQWPGFLLYASPRTIRSPPRIPSELHSYSRPGRPALASWFFCRLSFLSCMAYSPLPLAPCGDRSGLRSFLVSQAILATLPSADFCRPVRMDCSTLSFEFETNSRSPEVSSTAFSAQPPDLQPVPLMDTDFAVTCTLVRHRMPQIRFLYIGSRLCSTLPSDVLSRGRRCVSL
jgi:hypothetical protein